MSQLSTLDTLRSMRILEDMTAPELERLASVATLQEYAPETVVFREGQRPGRIYLISEGEISLEIRVPGHEARQVQLIGRGELLGWSPLLGPYPMTATARAHTAARLAVIDAVQLLKLFQDDPSFGFSFMKRTAVALAQRLSATRWHLLELCRHQLPEVAVVHHEGAD